MAKLKSLGMEGMSDDQHCDLAIDHEIKRMLDWVASTLPDSLVDKFYLEAKVEESLLKQELSGKDPDIVAEKAMSRFQSVREMILNES